MAEAPLEMLGMGFTVGIQCLVVLGDKGEAFGFGDFRRLHGRFVAVRQCDFHAIVTRLAHSMDEFAGSEGLASPAWAKNQKFHGS